MSFNQHDVTSVFRELALYQDYHGLAAFKKAIAHFMELLRGKKAKFDPDSIVLTAGATTANELLIFCLADPGDAFLVPTPYYAGFARDLRWYTGVEIVPVHCDSSNKFQITKSALESVYNKAQNQNLNVRGLIVTNPSNPLGTTLSAKALRNLLAFVQEKKIHLVCDEIYSGSTFSTPKFHSVSEILANENHICDNVHVVYSLSKDLGLPGFRVGAIYSYNKTVVTIARRMSSFCMVSSQTQHMLSILLSDSKFMSNFISENQKRLPKRHKFLVSGLKRAGITCLKSNAGLFCLVDMRHLLPSLDVKGELNIWQSILDKVGLNISSGSSFHCKEPAGWFRVYFSNMSQLTMQVSLDRIQSFVNNQSNRKLCQGVFHPKALQYKRGACGTQRITVL